MSLARSSSAKQLPNLSHSGVARIPPPNTERPSHQACEYQQQQRNILHSYILLVFLLRLLSCAPSTLYSTWILFFFLVSFPWFWVSLSSFLLLSPLLEPSLLFFLLSVRSLLGAVAVISPLKNTCYFSYLRETSSRSRRRRHASATIIHA